MLHTTKARTERRHSGIASIMAVMFLLLSGATSAVAEGPGRGLTKQFEIDYLRFIIDHHFSALRMTELAAGTLQTAPSAEVSSDDMTSPSPGFPVTQAKAKLDDVKSLARRNNRMQREEILAAQTFLRNFYGIDHKPQLSESGRKGIQVLENAQPGEDFDVEFMEVFSRHHYLASTRSSECQVASDPTHEDLEAYCRGIVQGQVADIDQMREWLCKFYSICDYQPLKGIEGEHS